MKSVNFKVILNIIYSSLICFFTKFTEFRPMFNEECKFQSYIKHNLFILNMFFMKFTEFRTNVNEECKFQSYIKHNIYYHALIMKFMGSGFNRQ